MSFMYDLPTEDELGALLEAKKKNKKTTEDPNLDVDTFFKFWRPTSGQGAVKLGDKTGVVKAKSALNAAPVRVDDIWDDFMKEQKAKDKQAKPVTKVDYFGSLVVDSYADTPDPKKVVGSIKPLKRTTIKDLSGKKTTRTEVLGEQKVITKSMAADPSKNNLVGIVKPKEDLGKQNIPDIFKKKPKLDDVSGAKTTVLKSYDGKLKATPNNVEVKSNAASPDKGNLVGVVKSKDATKEGKKVFKPIDGFKG